MIFELTDSLCAEILFAMENQQQSFALDANSKKVIECEPELVDEENLFTLPLWTSADGYNLLESFVSDFKGTAVSVELRKILAEGRGVFKNFKNTLKRYPEVNKRFHVYKDMKMKECVYEWYNALRESWGLELLNQDFYEYDDLVLEDFSMRAFNHSLDCDYVTKEVSAFFNEVNEKYSGTLGQAVTSQLKGHVQFIQQGLDQKSVNGFVCRTLTDDFAGCILYSSYESSSQKTAAITALFVNKNYRGLGIATQLLEKCASSLCKDGIQFLIFSNSIVPELLKSTLARLGFKENDFAFVAELN